MSNPLALADLEPDAERPRRPRRGVRKAPNPLASELATAASCAEKMQDRLVLCLLHARIQVHKDLARHKLANRVDLEEDARKVTELRARRDQKKPVEIRDCLEFLSKVTDDPPRRLMIPRFLELVTGLLRKATFGRPGTQGLTRRIDQVEAHARLIRGANSDKLKELSSELSIARKLEELLAA
jgi:hypothetical protein